MRQQRILEADESGTEVAARRASLWRVGEDFINAMESVKLRLVGREGPPPIQQCPTRDMLECIEQHWRIVPVLVEIGAAGAIG